MKHQYFGDVNDYHKYALLRALAGTGDFKIGVCWMMTAADSRSDGRKIGYLSKPDLWQHHDPDLFHFLHQNVAIQKRRHVGALEASGMIPGATFFSDTLEDEASDREAYFSRMLRTFDDRDLIFFDPDNGLEVASVSLGRRSSSKYLYAPEVRAAYNGGKSVLIFQHFAREKRDALIGRRVAQIRAATGARTVLSLQTAAVVYIMAVQRAHTGHCRSSVRFIGRAWGAKMSTVSIG